MKKSTFLPNFHIFCTILTFLHQNWYWQKHLSLCLKVCMTLFYHSYLEIQSFAQKLTLFATKNWHFSKTENTPLRILDISIKNYNIWKLWLLATKMKKILQNWCFCKIFAFTSEAHITKKLTLLKKLSFFTELTTNILLKPIVIFAKIDN